MDIEIRALRSVEELHQVSSLEREIWGTEPIPVHQTLTAVHNGGITLGAFDGDRLVGFLYSFPGFKDGNVYLCSHVMGIHPSAQNQKVGERLKLKQREAAMDRGYSAITWTFDPLLSLNAYLNLHKLGAAAVRYVENHYGTMGGLNSGLPSDRFQVVWSVSPDVQPNQTDATRSKASLDTEIRDDGLPIIACERLVVPDVSDCWSVPIPTDFLRLKSSDLSLAYDWRLKTRKVFQKLIGAGFVGVDVVRNQQGVSNYIFVRHSN